MIRQIEDFQNKMPGTYFETEKVYSHHGEVLPIWSICKKDDAKVATGYNFIWMSEDGRFSYMAGFF